MELANRKSIYESLRIKMEFIHVHHINAIAEIKRQYEIDPKNDLIPVCPNCHSMIHSKRPAFTIDEIKQIKTTANKSIAQTAVGRE